LGANDLLILKAPQFRARINDLLANLRESRELQELYIQDPVRIIQKAIFPEARNLPAAEINRGNRLLYALLSNEQFISWSREYEADLLARARDATEIEDPAAALQAYLAITDRSQIHQDVASAVARFADAETIAGLTWRPDPVNVNGTAIVNADVAVDIETFVYAVAAVAVFAVAVAAVFVGATEAAREEALSRLDLLDVVNELDTRLAERARAVRVSGALTEFSRRNTGFIR